MGVHHERYIDDDTADAMLDMYVRAFEPLKVLSATKQTLDDQDFRAFMAMDSVTKIVARDSEGQIVGFTMMTTELKLIPWISQEYYANRYPEHYDEGRLFYVPCILVDPSVGGAIWPASMARELALISASVHGIVLMDCCAHNDDVVGLPDLIEKVCHKYTHHKTELIDSQRFFALHHDGTKRRRARLA